MKNREMTMLACLCLLCGCGGTDEEKLFQEVEVLSPIQFTIDLEKEVKPFPGTKSMPDLTIPEPQSDSSGAEDPIAPPVDPEKAYSQIDYIVYQSGNPDVFIKRKTYTVNDMDFSIVYDSLPRGNYKICFLAHSDSNVEIDQQSAQFQKMADTFHLLLEQEINAGEKVVKDVQLQRIVSKIEFVATDKIPEDLRQFSLQATGWLNKIDLKTGYGIPESQPLLLTTTFDGSTAGKDGLTHALFTFPAASDSPIDFQLLATNQLGETLRERQVNDVHPIRNYIIRYSGILYTPRVSDDTFTLEILNDGAWEGVQNSELEKDWP